MSGATSPVGVLALLTVKGTHQFWCLQKYPQIVDKLKLGSYILYFASSSV
jgi:hypothetical protein